MESVSNHVVLARIAEQAERYEDMKEYIKYVATTVPEGQSDIRLSPEERNLLSVAYKNVVSSRRNAWRSIFALSRRNEPILLMQRRFLYLGVQEED